MMFRQVVAALLLKLSLVFAPQVTFRRAYTPYAFVDVRIAAESAAPLFDALTHDMRQAGKLDMDDPITAMGLSAHGYSNPARLALTYINQDGSMVLLSITRPQGTTFPKSHYDPSATYLVLPFGYRTEGVAKSIVSKKIIELIQQVRHECKITKVTCSIRARLQEPTTF